MTGLGVRCTRDSSTDSGIPVNFGVRKIQRSRDWDGPLGNSQFL